MVRPISTTSVKIATTVFSQMKPLPKIVCLKVFFDFFFSEILSEISAVKNLHFYNAPSSITLDELAHISSSFNINPPTKIRRFKEMQDKGNFLDLSKCFKKILVAGLLEYKSVQDAVGRVLYC